MSQGKLYPWPRPGWCPRCGSARLWGHGFVLRYFDGCGGAHPMKRWRCLTAGPSTPAGPRTTGGAFSPRSKPSPRASRQRSPVVLGEAISPVSASRAGTAGFVSRAWWTACLLWNSASCSPPGSSPRRFRSPTAQQSPGRRQPTEGLRRQILLEGPVSALGSTVASDSTGTFLLCSKGTLLLCVNSPPGRGGAGISVRGCRRGRPPRRALGAGRAGRCSAGRLH